MCSKETLELDKLAVKNPDIDFMVVSQDLPFALNKYAKANKTKNIKFVQGRFCAAEGIKGVKTVSAFRNNEFGKDYGVLITEGPFAGLFSRAVVLIDESGKIIYTEHVAELADEPNYDAVLKAL